jgi:hypothetical protein
VKEELAHGGVDLGIGHFRMPVPEAVRADPPKLVAHLAGDEHALGGQQAAEDLELSFPRRGSSVARRAHSSLSGRGFPINNKVSTQFASFGASDGVVSQPS